MTRIGFAYNQKPEFSAPRAAADADAAPPDEEPPSSRRDVPSRTPAPPPRPSPLPTSDEYAEWDTSETIDAVAGALGALGEVIRLEANADFPERLRRARPDIVFNMAEGLHGVNRESHVPAICEFFAVPYSGSDPFTLSLCLDKARTKEVLSYYQIPNAPFVLVRDGGDLDALLEGLRIADWGRTSPAAGVFDSRAVGPQSAIRNRLP